jgi:hypothetical protein
MTPKLADPLHKTTSYFKVNHPVEGRVMHHLFFDDRSKADTATVWALALSLAAEQQAEHLFDPEYQAASDVGRFRQTPVPELQDLIAVWRAPLFRGPWDAARLVGDASWCEDDDDDDD